MGSDVSTKGDGEITSTTKSVAENFSFSFIVDLRFLSEVESQHGQNLKHALRQVKSQESITE